MKTTPKYSFVLPAFNESACIESMTRSLNALESQIDGPFEIIWVNDGSTDDTAEQLDALAEKFDHIRVIHFSRNFGHMAALCAGLEAARATDAVITLDSDGQHPPELIPDMIALWKQGADIVQTIREDTRESAIVKRVTSWGFYAVFNLLADTDIPHGAADFRLMDREVVDALNGLPERVRFVRGLVHWVGFTRACLPYKSEARMAGKTKYHLPHMVSLALKGITSFSVRPLRFAFILTLLVVAAISMYSIYVLVALIRGAPLIPGWTSMIFVVLFLGAAQLLVIGIASEYLAHLYIEEKHRPVYLVRKKRERKKQH